MDSKQLNEFMQKISQYLDDKVQEGIKVVKYIDESMDSDGIKIDDVLLVREFDGELMLEKIIDIPATKYDPADIIFEELAVVATIDEMLPLIEQALQEEMEEREATSWMDYEDDIGDTEEEDDEDY